MIPHPYLYEKLIASHHSQIQHEMQQIRMQAHVRQRRTLVRLTVGNLGALLVALGYFLQRTGQQNKASFPSS